MGPKRSMHSTTPAADATWTKGTAKNIGLASRRYTGSLYALKQTKEKLSRVEGYISQQKLLIQSTWMHCQSCAVGCTTLTMHYNIPIYVKAQMGK